MTTTDGQTGREPAPTADDEVALHAEIMQRSQQDALSTLARTIAHELNQPLTAAASYVGAVREIAATGPPDPALLAELLDKAAAQIGRAGEVMNSLRDSVETGALVLADEPVNDLVAEAVALAARRDGDPAVILALDPAVPVAALDRIQIQQAVLNLLRNALDSVAAAGQGEVVVATRVADRGWVEIVVSDSGGGLPGNDEDLFAPFYTTKAEGMGLGLTIARTIIERHGGRLTARGREAGGAEFRAALPVAAGE